MSSSASEAMLNQSLFEGQYLNIFSSQLGIFPFYNNCFSSPSIMDCSLQTLITAAAMPPFPISVDSSVLTIDSEQSVVTRQNEDFQILSSQRSHSNYWAWGESSDCMSMKRNDHLGASAMMMKKMMINTTRKIRDPRFCFKTMSDVDVMDDGYKWRKYGQKVVKNTQHPRSYYRCTQDKCRVKKRVERLADDPRMVITTYEGRHAHTPTHGEDDCQASSQLNDSFW